MNDNNMKTQKTQMNDHVGESTTKRAFEETNIIKRRKNKQNGKRSKKTNINNTTTNSFCRNTQTGHFSLTVNPPCAFADHPPNHASIQSQSV
jgi:hypothetical protein